MLKYFKNCFWLLVPIFIWNIALYPYLPREFSSEVFQQNMPPSILWGENILRIIVFIIPAFIPLSLKEKRSKKGLVLFSIGSLIYFLSWLLLILFPSTAYSNNIIAFTAPAWTTIIWFIGIGMVGRKTFWGFKYTSTVYIIASTLFVIFHTAHVAIVFYTQ